MPNSFLPSYIHESTDHPFIACRHHRYVYKPKLRPLNAMFISPFSFHPPLPFRHSNNHSSTLPKKYTHSSSCRHIQLAINSTPSHTHPVHSYQLHNPRCFLVYSLNLTMKQHQLPSDLYYQPLSHRNCVRHSYYPR